MVFCHDKLSQVFYARFDITICSMLIIWLECVAELIEKHGSAVVGSSGRREAQHAMTKYMVRADLPRRHHALSLDG